MCRTRKRNITPNSLRVGLCVVPFFQGGRYEKSGGGMNNFTVENPDELSLNPVIKMKINIDKSS